MIIGGTVNGGASGQMAMESTTYHVWFATKRRKWLLQGDVDLTVKKTIKETAREKGITVVECETAVDHVHLLLRLHSDQTLPKTMNLLKGVSSRKLHLAFPDLKLDSGSTPSLSLSPAPFQLAGATCEPRSSASKNSSGHRSRPSPCRGLQAAVEFHPSPPLPGCSAAV